MTRGKNVGYARKEGIRWCVAFLYSVVFVNQFATD